MLNDALASSHFAIAGKLTGHDAIVVRGACDEPSVLLVDGDGPRLEPAGDLWGLSAAEAEQRPARAARQGWRVASIGPAGRAPGASYATVSHDGRHAGRGGLGAVLGREAAQGGGRPRRRRRSRPADPQAVLAAARDLRARSFGPATAKYRELGTLANLLAFNAIATLPTRNFQAATFAEAPRLAAEDLAEARGVARDSCASCSIGCEHIYKGAGGTQDARRVRERLRPRPAVRRVRPGRRAGGERPLRRARARHHLGRRDDRLGHGVRRARPDRRAVAALRRRGRAAARDRRDRRARGARRAAGARGPAPRPRSSARAPSAFAPHVKGLELPGYEPRTLQAMALGLAVNARGADHNRSGAYEADLSGAPRPPRAAAQPHVAAAIETEDRAAVMDSLILCKFLRGVFDDPFPEWARAARQRHRLGRRRRRAARRPRAGSCSPSARSTPARAGRAPTTGCRSASSTRRSRSAPARSAALTRERLDAMIAGYYEARGLDPSGGLADAQTEDLRLGAPARNMHTTDLVH